jgi:FMN phosphatase YigB (HAD superfamily)
MSRLIINTPLKPTPRVNRNFAVLFDIDGVIVRNKPLLHKVGKNCTQFINLINRDQMYLSELEKYNEQLYNIYGHSLKGWLMENSDSKKYINSNYLYQLFNRYVYDGTILCELEKYLKSDEFKSIYYEMTDTISICNSYNISIGLFSNAPYEWCNIVANKINIPLTNVYSSDHELLHKNMLYKPDINAFNNIQHDMCNKNKNIHELIFIDDSLKNITAINNYRIWKPIYFNPENKKYNSYEANGFHRIQEAKSITEINMIISEYIDN